ncbi:hypothetical protein D9M73_65860 [compost metagenome]|nr:MAG TPA: hypothetical protein [Caudoviricetes sp.]
MSRYAIRHATSGLERSFESKQHIADFFHEEGHDPADWDGHQCLGPLPEPTPVLVPEEDWTFPFQDDAGRTGDMLAVMAKTTRTARAVAAVKKAVTPKKKAAKK